MMLTPQMQDALNAQIGLEFAAAMKYEAMGAHFDAEALPQLAQRYFTQAEEERTHAKKFLRYVLDAGGRVQIPAIPAPKSEFATAEDAAKAALDSELEVTRSINRLMDLAIADSDHATAAMLQWFVSEQVEEVATADQLLRIIQRAGENNLLLVEDFLAKSSTAPTA